MTTTAKRSVPKNWRTRMPAPEGYYREVLPTLSRTNGTGWAQSKCPFHDDSTASLSVHIDGDRGAWRCFASCGGGDLVGFHMKLRGLDFNDAIMDLLRGGR